MEPVEYYHVSCIDSIFHDLPALIEAGQLEMEGAVSSPPESHISYESSPKRSRTDSIIAAVPSTLAAMKTTHDAWEREDAVNWIQHQLSHAEPDDKCRCCQSLPPPEERLFPRRTLSCFIERSTRISERVATYRWIAKSEETG